MYRLLTIGAALLWVTSMTALFVRDVWPTWTAQDAPPMTRDQFARLRDVKEQFGIFGSNNQRMGTAWNSVSSAGNNLTLSGMILVDGLPMVRRVRVETTTDFDSEGGLDSFDLRVYGVPLTTIRVHGERRGIYFPCQMNFGPIERQASLDLSASRMIGEALRPFSFLPTLSVGQSWRMQLLDPISVVMGRQTEFTSIVATVTGLATIDDDGEQVECFVVETSPHPAKAWVRKDGRVIRQEVEMPGLGKVSIRQEPYDQEKRNEATQLVPAWSPAQND